MRAVRVGLTIFSIAALAIGYALSQRAFFGSDAAAYAKAVDQPAIQYGATALLLLCVIFALMRDRDSEPE